MHASVCLFHLLLLPSPLTSNSATITDSSQSKLLDYLTDAEAENVRNASSILSYTIVAPSVSQYVKVLKFPSLPPLLHLLLPFVIEVHLIADINSA